jgi:hypothetical protein
MEYFLGNPFLLAIPFLISLMDFMILARSRFITHHKITPQTKDTNDFSILVPIFGSMSYLKNIDYLKQYSQHVILCTTTKESVQFNREIEEIASEHGFRIFRSEVHQASSKYRPNPWDVFTNTLNAGVAFNRDMARDEIMRDSF